MTTLRKAAQQALEALESGNDVDPIFAGETMTLLRKALEQPEQCSCGDRLKDQCPGEWEPGCDLGNNPKYARRVPLKQEPVAWIEHGLVEAPDGLVWEKRSVGYYTPLYTHPPRREWRSLSEKEIDAIQWHGSPFQFARAIEAALRSKNHE
jgi:hypothetical protein